MGDMGDIFKEMKQERRELRGLLTLASWAQSRAMGEHDDETTLTMLDRKTAELRAAVYKAGWDSVAASHSPNDQAQ